MLCQHTVQHIWLLTWYVLSRLPKWNSIAWHVKVTCQIGLPNPDTFQLRPAKCAMSASQHVWRVELKKVVELFFLLILGSYKYFTMLTFFFTQLNFYYFFHYFLYSFKSSSSYSFSNNQEVNLKFPLTILKHSRMQISQWLFEQFIEATVCIKD